MAFRTRVQRYDICLDDICFDRLSDERQELGVRMMRLRFFFL